MIADVPETGLLNNGELIAPPGRKKGLNFRDDRPGEHCGFFREIRGIDIIPQEEWEGYIQDGISLEGNASNHIMDQDGVGSCAAEGAYGIVETMRDVEGEEFVLFNPWAGYHFSSGGVDRGSTLSANLRLVRDTGCVPASIWPRSKGWRKRPSSEALEAAKAYRLDEFYEINNWVEYGSALLQRFAVYSGYSGHAWFAVALLNERQIKWRNSWGKGWGDGGFGVLNASRIVWNYGCYAARTTTVT